MFGIKANFLFKLEYRNEVVKIIDLWMVQFSTDIDLFQ